MNESHPTLNDLELFLAVAEAGSLTAAGAATQTPLPTLSRRMTALERQLTRTLFMRGKSGYALTADGRALAASLIGLHDIKRQVSRWQTQSQGPTKVRITAGFWTSRFLAQNLTIPTSAGWVPVFVPSNVALDLARREADIGIRNRTPDHPWLARQRLRSIDYAIYANDPSVQGFVTLPQGVAMPPSQHWVHRHHSDQIVTTASDTRLCLDLALSGFGQIVLPCFIGDAETGLSRRSDAIADLHHDEWLISHHQARHDPPIRAALRAIGQVLTGRAQTVN